MGVGEKRRVKRDRAEWAQLLERFERSGLSGAAFCQREGICKSSFARWKRLLGAQSPHAASEFVEWGSAAAPGSTTSLAAGELELLWPSGARLRWKP